MLNGFLVRIDVRSSRRSGVGIAHNNEGRPLSIACGLGRRISNSIIF